MREKHQLVSSHRCPTRDQTWNLSTCPDWELNRPPFALCYDTQPSHTGSGRSVLVFTGHTMPGVSPPHTKLHFTIYWFYIFKIAYLLTFFYNSQISTLDTFTVIREHATPCHKCAHSQVRLNKATFCLLVTHSYDKCSLFADYLVPPPF